MSPQQSIAHYKIVSKLGEGGMGAVYRATDTKLNRDVAIKVLPDSFAQDPDRMARFQREAQLLASLNHPNIAAIYGIEQGAIVMELVEGEDLHGPVPLDTALDYARQIAAGLEAAHEKGIVHRDLKPGNIKVSADGVIKLLDFGLAKAGEASAASASATQSPTLSLSMTQAGMILGTAAYMSPEQARGKGVDKRADIWAFGVVLFEMLTGKPMFAGGETVTDTIAAVVTREPDWSLLPKETPSNVRRLLRRCLHKDPKQRLRDIGDARIALGETPEVGEEIRAAGAAPKSGRIRWLASTLAALTAIGFGIAWWRSSRPPPPLPLMRLTVNLGESVALVTSRGTTSFDVSPDGSRLALLAVEAGQRVLATRLLSREELTYLAGTIGAESPFFSPDGQWIGFWADGALKKVAVNGGAPLTLCPANTLRGASWAEEDAIIASIGEGPLMRIPAAGGAPSAFTHLLKDERTHRFPQYLPEYKLVLMTAAGVSTNYDESEIVALSLNTGARKALVKGGHGARYLPSGHLVYERNGTLYAARFDPVRVALTGIPAPVLEGVRDQGAGASSVTFSRRGTLIFSSGDTLFDKRQAVWIDPAGKIQEIDPAAGIFLNPRLSPDNKRVVYATETKESGVNDIWVRDLERGTATRLSFTPGNNISPAWTPDGKAIVYRNSQGEGRSSAYWIPADGSGQAQSLERDIVPDSFSPDGKVLAGASSRTPTAVLTAEFRYEGGRPILSEPKAFAAGAKTSLRPAISPDGKWIAYEALDSGQREVYVRPFPGPGGRWQISAGGGATPRWATGTHQLFYQGPRAIMCVDYTASQDSFQAGTPRAWAREASQVTSGRFVWDITADGKRAFLFRMLSDDPRLKSRELTFLVNFFDELKRRLP